MKTLSEAMTLIVLFLLIQAILLRYMCTDTITKAKELLHCILHAQSTEHSAQSTLHSAQCTQHSAHLSLTWVILKGNSIAISAIGVGSQNLRCQVGPSPF